MPTNQRKWLSGYRIKKKPVPQISRSPETRSPNPHLTVKFVEKTQFRRSLQQHITAVQKVKCVVPECPKCFWKPMPGNEWRHNRTLLRHHAAKHFSDQ